MGQRELGVEAGGGAQRLDGLRELSAPQQHLAHQDVGRRELGPGGHDLPRQLEPLVESPHLAVEARRAAA